ncbi:MAG: DUF1003 domain-containing protein [archaeon]|nr:MAG: DUF1003 domain-containing protein [archaeon]
MASKKEVKEKTKKKNKYRYPVTRKKLTLGEKAADKLTKVAGSWSFIISMLVFMAIWMWINISAYIGHWDPYPFILLNFVLSCLAALQAPIILMSQNREAQRDRQRAEYDYQVDKKAEREIKDMQKDLKKMEKLVKELHSKFVRKRKK